MSPLSTVAVAAVAARSLHAALQPVAAAGESFADLLRPDPAGASSSGSSQGGGAPTGLDDLRTRIAAGLQDLIAGLSAGQADSASLLPGGVAVERTPLQHLYVQGDSLASRDLELAIENQPELLDALRQWFAASGQTTFRL